jgi:hypothetical protein
MDAESEHCFVSLGLHLTRKEKWMLKANTSPYADQYSIPEANTIGLG